MIHKHLNKILFYIFLILPTSLFPESLPDETLNGTNNEIVQATFDLYLEAQKNLEFPKALDMAQKMTSLSKAKNDIEGQLLAQIIREEHFLMTERADSMLSCIKQIEKLTGPNSKYKFYYFRCRYWIAEFHIYKHHYAAALNEIKEYQRLALEWNDNSGIGLGYKLVGDLLLSQKKDNSAISLYKKGYEYLHKHGSLPDEIVTAIAMGKYYYNNYQEDKALQYLKRVGTHDYEENFIMDAYSSMAICYMAKGDKKNMEACLMKVEEIKATHSMFPQISDSYNYVRFVKSFTIDKDLKKSIEICNSMNDPLLRYTSEASLYAEMGNFKKAYELSMIRDGVRDSLEDIEEVEMLASYQSQFDYSVLQTEKERLEHENITLELHDAKVKETVLWVTLIAIFAIGGVYTIYRRRILKHLNVAKNKAEKAQREAEQARLKAEQADNLKTFFLQNMSHEIRTPLNAIIGFNELLNNKEMNTELSEEEKNNLVKMIQTNSELLLTLVNDILDLSKLESGTYKRILSEVNLSKLCKTILASVNSRIVPGVELKLRCNPDSFILNTDALRLQQLLTNFLTNAAKYTETGYIELSYIVEKGMVKFAVTDTGTGIPSEDRNRIFNRFEKLDDFKQGTGLGLNICKCISDMLDGNIYIDTEYNDGAKFVFEHPVNL